MKIQVLLLSLQDGVMALDGNLVESSVVHKKVERSVCLEQKEVHPQWRGGWADGLISMSPSTFFLIWKCYRVNWTVEGTRQ